MDPLAIDESTCFDQEANPIAKQSKATASASSANEIDFNSIDYNVHYEFSTTIMENMQVNFDIIQFGKSVIVWIGGDGLGLNDLSFAIKTPYDRGGPTTTKLLANFGDSFSTSLASKLSTKLGKPVYVSFNLSSHDARMTEQIENCLFHAIKLHPERF